MLEILRAGLIFPFIPGIQVSNDLTYVLLIQFWALLLYLRLNWFLSVPIYIELQLMDMHSFLPLPKSNIASRSHHTFGAVEGARIGWICGHP